MNRIRLRKTKTGKVSAAGLTEGDCRLIGQVLRAGSFEADSGGPRSEAVLRLAHAFFVMAQYGPVIADHDIIGGSADLTMLYEDPENLPGASG